MALAGFCWIAHLADDGAETVQHLDLGGQLADLAADGEALAKQVSSVVEVAMEEVDDTQIRQRISLDRLVVRHVGGGQQRR
jgi:hypothetical protein